jgi:hypothetical protein
MRSALLGRLSEGACPDIERVTTSRTYLRFYEARWIEKIMPDLRVLGAQ